ncbi:MAG: HIT domain-containing protein [Anaerolineae bacterium]|nr:HIT domain-containing protein [Anaerolineae bacterium]HRX02039.1 HIT domain-containing protein [Anaerolineae bacterium]
MGPKDGACVFCSKIAPGDDRAEHVLWRGELAFMVLNRYPYNNGHLLILPYAHVASLEDLPPETLTEMMLLVNRGLAAVRESMAPHGFNVGVNLGRAAGAGIESHVHIHVVPRWGGDTNFMTTVSETRNIPETLDQTYDRLSSLLHKQSKEKKESRT